MSTDTNHIVGPLVQRPIHVAIYEHPYGTDVRVFINEDLAWEWRTVIAQEWWSNAFQDDPPPDDQIGAEYFERMLERDEFFSIQSCALEIGGETPADSAFPAPRSDDGGAS